MPRYTRLDVTRQGEVPVSADQYWQALLDWGAVLEWMPSESPPIPLAECGLVEGHAPGKLPCTRVLRVDMKRLPEGMDHNIVPELLYETVFHVDETARVLYYTLDGRMPFGMRNYVACTEVDELAFGRARVTNTGRVDIPEGTPMEPIRMLMEDTYDRGIIRGIGAYAARRAAHDRSER